MSSNIKRKTESNSNDTVRKNTKRKTESNSNDTVCKNIKRKIESNSNDTVRKNIKRKNESDSNDTDRKNIKRKNESDNTVNNDTVDKDITEEPQAIEVRYVSLSGKVKDDDWKKAIYLFTLEKKNRFSFSKKIEDSEWESINLSELASNIRLSVSHSVTGMSSNELYVPPQLADRIIEIRASSQDGRTVHILGADRFPNLKSLHLDDGLILPRYNDVDIPIEFEERAHSSYIMNKHKEIKNNIGNIVFISAFANRSADQNGDKMIEALKDTEKTTTLIPYKDIGRLVYPVLHDLDMTMYQHYGWCAGSQTLGTLSHLDGELSLFIRDVGDWIDQRCIEVMHKFIRFPNVKVLRLRYWDQCYGPHRQNLRDVSENRVAMTWADIRRILKGFFGHVDQMWNELERIEFDVASECSHSRVPLKFVLKYYFPKDEWMNVIRHSPKLNAIGYWERQGNDYIDDLERLSLEPFIYSLELRYPMDPWSRRKDAQIHKIIESAKETCPIKPETIEELTKKCTVCTCCTFGGSFVTY